MTTKILLSAVAGLLALHLVVLSNAAAPRTAVAAGLPDTGAQFQAMIDELQGINKRLDKLQAVIESGNVTVKVKVVEKETK